MFWKEADRRLGHAPKHALRALAQVVSGEKGHMPSAVLPPKHDMALVTPVPGSVTVVAARMMVGAVVEMFIAPLDNVKLLMQTCCLSDPQCPIQSEMHAPIHSEMHGWSINST
ncbi:hypothetical protein D1007_01617 [Hordeum vulgare]|nr:hypothetical protein D1007_01617 [Hordeum vulgare]